MEADWVERGRPDEGARSGWYRGCAGPGSGTVDGSESLGWSIRTNAIPSCGAELGALENMA